MGPKKLVVIADLNMYKTVFFSFFFFFLPDGRFGSGSCFGFFIFIFWKCLVLRLGGFLARLELRREESVEMSGAIYH